MKTLIIVLLTGIFAIQAAAANIYRVDGNGDVIKGPIYFYVHDRDADSNLRVSDLGYIYFADYGGIDCFDGGLNFINHAGFATSHACLGIDNVRNKVMSEDTISIFSPTLVLENQFEVLSYVSFMTVDDQEGTVWYTHYGHPGDDGLFKCSMTGDPIYYFPDTAETTLSSVAADGTFWVKYAEVYNPGVRKRDRNGNIIADSGPGALANPYDMEIYFADGSLWALTSSGGDSGITKVNSTGSIVYENFTDFDRPYAIDVNQNDGSVWIADTYNYQLVHLDANGVELLRKDWDYVLVEVAVDQADNTVIVVDDNIAVEITPSSLGRIKAGFAEGQ
jgi:hypothetical protein